MVECELVLTAEQMQNRDAWLEARKQGIGGSDASCIVGVNPWKSPFALWMEKTGQAEPADLSDSEAVMWGNRLENDVAQYFSEKEGKKIRKSGLLRNKKHPWMMASPDRLIIGEEAGLEIKTTAYWNKEAWKDDEIPAGYLIQCLHYLLVTGLERWYIACLLGGQHYICKVIERKDVEEDLKALEEAEEKFWNEYVVTKKIPPVDDTDSCAKVLKDKYPGGDVEAVELDESMDLLLQDRAKYKEQIKALEKSVTLIDNKLYATLGNHDFGRSSTYNVWWAPTSRAGFNSKQFQKDYPDLYDKYRQDTVYRKLVVKISKARTEGGN